MWRLQSPEGEEICEDLTLDIQGDAVLRVLGRPSIARHVPEIDGEVRGKRFREGPPQL
jgi:hypothetical protein